MHAVNVKDLTALEILDDLDDQIQVVIDQLADLQHTTQANKLYQVQRDIRDLIDALANQTIDIGDNE